MVGRPPRKSVQQRISDAKRRFEETGEYDPKDVMLAIGISPDRPPTWALDCCFDLFERHSHGVQSPTNDDRPDMDVLLDQVVRVFFQTPDDTPFEAMRDDSPQTPPSFAQAYRDAMAATGIALELRAVETAWQKELKEDIALSPQAGSFNNAGLPDTPRVRRVFEEMVSERFGFRWPSGPSNYRKWRERRDARLRTE
ncbi:MAG: hypothetical protein KDJ90_09525 [Nitratireductor sp.]|nr:hypothetical protein [Nitratireductor sp.]